MKRLLLGRWVAVAGAAVLVAGVATATLAVAASTASHSSKAGYAACSNASHALFVEVHGRCPAGTHEVHISARGPQGLRGENGATGAAGPAGAPGPQGPAGTNGTNGTNGTSILTGSGVPSGSCSTGDSYIQLVTTFDPYIPAGEVYNCVASSWVDSGSSIRGPQGLPGLSGPAGPAGPPGTNGNTILSGSTTPTGGANGDFYLDTSTETLYGPKANGSWPATGTSLVGPSAASCQVTDGASSYTDLQTAINDAKSGDTLVVSGTCDGNFFVRPSTLTIEGSPMATLNGEGSGTVVYVSAGDTVTLDNLVITGGSNTGGGGIINLGSLTLEGDSQVDNNTVTGGNGGGIFNFGGVTLEGDSQVDNNTATGGNGGGIYNIGSLTLEGGSQVDGNTVTGGGSGGGIFNFGSVTLEGGSQVDGNTAAGDGGGIFNYNALTLEGDSQVDNNTVTGGGSGGGIFNTPAATESQLDAAQVADNTP